MIQGFYAATVGAQQQMERMTVQANNMANANTYGYKAESPSFGTLLYGMIQGVEGNDVPKGSGTQMVSAATNFDKGGFVQTARPLDYAIFEEGFFALMDFQTGEISYTRDGSFTLSSYETANGQEFYLSDGAGRLVLDANYDPIIVTNQNEVQPVGVFEIQYKDGLLHLDNGRFAVDPDKNGTVTAIDSPQVEQGFLEESNSDLATEMARVIETQKAYSYAISMLRTADEVETTINQLRG